MFRKRTQTLGLMAAACLASILWFGCGEDGNDGLPIDEVAAGWSAFQNEDYDLGITNFQAAAREAPGWAEPYNGLGWSYTPLDSLSTAAENFDHALERNADFTDALAGKAIVKLALGDYQAAGRAASKALELGEDKYAFRYDTSVNARALRIVLAECAFHQGDYATAEEQVELVDFTIVIDPADPDYLERLLEIIGRLSRG